MLRESLLETAAIRHGLAGLDFNADGLCAFTLGNGLHVDLQLLDPPGECRIAVALGEVLPEALQGALVGALLGNTAVSGVARSHLAYHPGTGQLYLCGTLPAHEAEATAVFDAIDFLAAAAREQRQQLQAHRVVGCEDIFKGR